MQGLELSREYYAACRQGLYEAMPCVMEQACAGLCGEGSECFGCDDEISRDHDFGASFCLWLPQKTLFQQKELLAEVFAKLPGSFLGMPANFGEPGQSRRGPLSVEGYYRFFTGLDEPPADWRQWLSIPEKQLAACVNGEVFEDNAGLFSAWREKLRYYPEDIRLKKLAARCMQMAQSGQYNLPRSLQRGEAAAAFLALSQFTEAAIAFVFLANRQYMPFYKWAPRLARELPILAKELERLLNAVTASSVRDYEKIIEAVEDFCSACADWLIASDLSDMRDNWLWVHGPQIMRRVQNPEIRSLNLLKEGL